MTGPVIAWERGILKNPCTGVKKLQEKSDVGRALKSDEIKRLKMALDAEPNRLGAKEVLLF